MGRDVRQFVEWMPLASNRAAHRELSSWMGKVPPASVQVPVVPNALGWIWQLVEVLPHASESIWLEDLEPLAYARERTACLQGVVPTLDSEVVAIWEDLNLKMSTADAIECFADDVRQLLVVSPDLAKGVQFHYTEFAYRMHFDPGPVEAISRVSSYVVHGTRVVPKERFVIRFRDGRLWESGRLGHAVEREPLEHMIAALSEFTGLRVDEAELNPWDATQRRPES